MAHVFLPLSLLVTLIVASVFRQCVLAQDSCSQINVTNETAGTPRMAENEFYLDIDNPATSNGTVASWKVCYHGPTNPGNKRYEVVYSIYRSLRVSGYDDDMLYCKVSNAFSTTLRSTDSINGGDSNNANHMSRPGSNRYCPLYDGFHCFNVSLDPKSSPVFIRTGDIIGACVNNPLNNGTCSTGQRRLDIVGGINYYNNTERSLFHMTTNECGKMRSKFPSGVWLNQLSPLNSTILHLYVDISKLKCVQ